MTRRRRHGPKKRHVNREAEKRVKCCHTQKKQNKRVREIKRQLKLQML